MDDELEFKQAVKDLTKISATHDKVLFGTPPEYRDGLLFRVNDLTQAQLRTRSIMAWVWGVLACIVSNLVTGLLTYVAMKL